MATKLFLRNTTVNGITDTGDGVVYDLITTAGAGADTGVVDTVAGGTNIQWTKTAGGLSMAWISGRVPAGGFTLTSADISAWLHQSNNAANTRGRVRIYKYEPGTPTITELGGPFDDDKTELTTTTATEDTWTADVTDTAFAENDRILVQFFITNNGTMGANRTATITFNAADAATGDSFVTIAETVAFKAEVKSLPADAGSFAVTGTAASLELGYKVAGDAGSYSVSGTAASLERGYEVAADSAAFAFSGTDASLEYGHLINAESGSFSFTGTAADLTVVSSAASRIEVSWVELALPPSVTAYSLAVDSGSYVFSGTAASLEHSGHVSAEAGSFAFTGSDVLLERTRLLMAEGGAYEFIGSSEVTLTHAEAVGGADDYIIRARRRGRR